MRNLYDIARDQFLQELIEERQRYFDDAFYVEKYGRYGTDSWLKSLQAEELVVSDVCKCQTNPTLPKWWWNKDTH